MTCRMENANSKKTFFVSPSNPINMAFYGSTLKPMKGAYTTITTSKKQNKKRLVMTLVTVKLIRLPGPSILGDEFDVK